jgi:7-cyano-7-deazaguanine synthase
VTNATRKAVVLLSGGLDSTTALAIAQQQGYAAQAITFDYGQRHAGEVQAARRIAARMRVDRHIVVAVDLRQFGGSALTADVPVPQSRSVDQIGKEIPVTYVPARNTIFLSLALAWAETLDSGELFIGVNSLDYSGYPDCRPEYLEAFERMANLATKKAVEGSCPVTIHAPLVRLTKKEIIRRGLELGAPYELTKSCYAPASAERLACGACDACLLRLRGFAENGVPDPIPYLPARTPR